MNHFEMPDVTVCILMTESVTASDTISLPGGNDGSGDD